MQVYLNHTHINTRFKERFGRPFTARDRRNIIELVRQGKAKIVKSRDDPNKNVIYCQYEGVNSIFVVANNMDFITYMKKE